MTAQQISPLVSRVRRLTFATLAIGPALCLAFFLRPILHTLSWSDLWRNPTGLAGFLLLLLGPYVLFAGITLWLATTRVQAVILLSGALILAVFGIAMWYDILVRDGSPLALFVLLGVHWLQVGVTAVFTGAALIVRMIERRRTE